MITSANICEPNVRVDYFFFYKELMYELISAFAGGGGGTPIKFG